MPENCGYGFRMVSLNIFSEKLEFKSQGKIIESSIRLEQILKTQISQISLDMIKASKKITQEQLKNKTRQKKTFLPFALILEERGRVELIARSEKDLENFVNGVNALLQVKKELEFLKDKIEVNCNCN